MSTINIDLAADTILNVMIGQQDENEVREVVFDFSGWYTTYGSGTISLAIQRPKDEWPYEGTLTVDSTSHKATWEISETDTAYAGTGKIQLSYKVGDAKKKSVVYRFTCHKSLGALGSVVTPVQIQTFIDEVEEALQTMDGKLDDMEDEITDVKTDLADLQEEIEGGGQGLTAEFKQALHNIFEKVAFIDGNGQDYLDALDDAMSSVTAISLNTSTLSFSSLNSTQTLVATTTPSGGAVSWSSSNTSVATVSSSGVVTSVGYGSATITASSGSVSASCSVVVAQATLVSIACVYTQSGTVYESTSLDSLKDDLVVTATWDNSTTSTVASTDYELSGTLTEGTSTITVTYGGKTTTFNVTVSSSINYVAIGSPTIENGILTVENGKYVRSNYALSPTSGQAWKIRQKFKYSNLPSGFVNIMGGADDNGFFKSFVIQENNSKQYIFYVSADGSNWTVSNQYTGNNLNLNTDDWFYVEFGYDGTQYYITIKKDGWDGTLINTFAHKEFTSNAVMINGKYVGFGVTSTVSGFDGQIDLNDCSIYVDDVLVWQAIAA